MYHFFSFCRQLALKALNERLKRVEDQSAWPSMEDEDEENTKADTPLLPEKSRDSAGVGKASSQESSLITFEDAPSQLWPWSICISCLLLHIRAANDPSPALPLSVPCFAGTKHYASWLLPPAFVSHLWFCQVLGTLGENWIVKLTWEVVSSLQKDFEIKNFSELAGEEGGHSSIRNISLKRPIKFAPA